MSVSHSSGATVSFSEALNQVTVIVVTHESAHCLPALDGLLGQCKNLIVSDNGSLDGTPAQAARLWPQAQVLSHPRNLGFGAANNRALVRVSTPLAFLLNPDCEMTAQGLLQLVEMAEENPEFAILAPQLVSVGGKPEVNYRWPQTLWPSEGNPATGPACVGFVCGAAMLMRRDRFDDVGYFDEHFFLYYEDDDLCLRLFKAQRPIVVVPDVKAVHHSRGSVRGAHPWRSEYGRGFHHAQSKLIFAKKHQSAARALGLRQWLLFTTTLNIPFRALFFSPKLLARMVGRWMGLLRWSVNA
ncbi:glycosyl transferase [Hydrogenophaga crassostreae]|uniref:Glycosyl transferase n=1 Tax=Hydrogenophaga crassostreae TaxID=1763535 RepID=A0A163CI30_9BURK|nr:glycosyl transferase [Hydrogenophaga crassostreae]OAD42444.1 glycosyl transferase [Hydrogenophaga crassostreae]